MTPPHSLLAWWSALGLTLVFLQQRPTGANTLGKRSMVEGALSAETRLHELLASIDDRLSRLDYAFDQLSRRVESVESKLVRLDAKLDLRDHDDAFLSHLDAKLERVDSKLDSLDRDLHGAADDLLERMVKGEDRCTRREEKVEEVGERVLAVSGGLVRRLEQMDAAAQRGINRTEEALQGIERHLSDASDRLLSTMLENHSKIDNLTSSLVHPIAGVQLEDLRAVLDSALSGHDAKFKELDSDVETYTRKVVHGVQELWKTSDDLRSELSLTLEQGGKTREVVRQEFRRLRETVSPLSAVTEELNRQVLELSATVDASFATLLVAQNAFIDTCRRVQEEETHVYDVLQQVVYEMRNRSAADVRIISEQLSAHAADLDRTLAGALVDMRRECAIGGRPSSTDDDLTAGGGRVNRTSDDDLLYDFESESLSPGNLSEYEDYQPYFPEST